MIRNTFCNLWLAIGISLFCCSASAEMYPISGVWVAKGDRFPGSTPAACLLLKEFGGDVPSAEPLPRVMIFSRDKRFEMREGFFAENTIKSIESTQGGAFKIIETLGKRRFRLSKKRSFTLKIVNATTIEVTRKHQHAIV
jgi:hypothetical protein